VEELARGILATRCCADMECTTQAQVGVLGLRRCELAMAVSESRDESWTWDGRMRGALRRESVFGSGGAMPCTARPAALEVRNNCKDVSPAMVDGRF
jgi:hypothetical protein